MSRESILQDFCVTHNTMGTQIIMFNFGTYRSLGPASSRARSWGRQPRRRRTTASLPVPLHRSPINLPKVAVNLSAQAKLYPLSVSKLVRGPLGQWQWDWNGELATGEDRTGHGRGKKVAKETGTIIMMHQNIICKIWNSLTIHFMRRINIAVIMLFDVATGPGTVISQHQQQQGKKVKHAKCDEETKCSVDTSEPRNEEHLKMLRI